MAIKAFLSIGSRKSFETFFSSLNLWGTLHSTSRLTAVKAENRMVETGCYHYHFPRKTYRYSSDFSVGLPVSFFRRYYSPSNCFDNSSSTCFNVDKPVTGKVKYSTNDSGANQPMKKLPIGIQSIHEILTEGYVYADKTGHAKHLIDTGKHYFLSRPRRFGKSLFLDTLREIFKGSKELFRECQIYDSSYDWQEHPVIYLDFSKIVNTTPEMLEIGLQEALQDVALFYGVRISGSSSLTQLNRLVAGLSGDTRAVVLVDEYDKPIIDRLHDLDVARRNRDILRSFFGTLKSLDTQLRFTFTTGVSKFSQVSLFSGPNNLEDITMDPVYAGMMGYTEEELRQCFSRHIQSIAQERNQRGMPGAEKDVLDEVREWYNGYRFTKEQIHVYNPFSTLKYMKAKEAMGYWYSTGTPSFLIDQLKKQPPSVLSLRGTRTSMSGLSDISSLDYIDVPALMFQTGYLTIQDYDSDNQSYRLDFPNREVREAFYSSLVKEFTRINPMEVTRIAGQVRQDLQQYELNSFIDKMNSHFAKMSYQMFSKSNEGFFQAVFFTLLEKSGIHTTAEVATNIGRIDLVSEMPKAVYIFELKLDRTADTAIDQAHTKKYKERYLHTGKEVLVMGINFSSTSRNISDWKGVVFDSTGKVKLEKQREV